MSATSAPQNDFCWKSSFPFLWHICLHFSCLFVFFAFHHFSSVDGFPRLCKTLKEKALSGRVWSVPLPNGKLPVNKEPLNVLILISLLFAIIQDL